MTQGLHKRSDYLLLGLSYKKYQKILGVISDCIVRIYQYPNQILANGRAYPLTEHNNE